ncbi:MAG TPA: cyclic nucleotide-binding domain-containing protein [Thermoplasmata archaeon]|jgi:CRP/FNR family transcriptional regulator|nr:cyclic nucleotide-binding domain-containing protein [Thermoplasmata archaeon]HYB78677.1 cyclic nucleotide-binding domain-containing protein [Thermoplasmata archaeon]
MSDPKDQPAAMDLLKTVPLFASLEKKYLKTLAATAADQRYKAGDVLIAEGQKGIGFYLIAEGQVNVEKGGRTVATLGPGQFFGEMALLDEEPRTATVKAVSPTRCLVLSSWEFWGTAAAGDPTVLKALLRETVRRLRQAAPGPED